MPVIKKNGKVKVCVDFWDLNEATPKDNFPLPHIDVLVDNTAMKPFILIHGWFFRIQPDQNV